MSAERAKHATSLYAPRMMLRPYRTRLRAIGSVCRRAGLAIVCLPALAACISSPEELDAETEAFIESYLAQSAKIEAERQAQQASAIHALQVTPTADGTDAMVTVHVENASLPELVQTILEQSKVSYSLANVGLHGRSTVRFENLPLERALNLMVTPAGVAVSKRNGIFIFSYGASIDEDAAASDDDKERLVRTQLALKHLDAEVAVQMIGQLAPGFGVVGGDPYGGGGDESGEGEGSVETVVESSEGEVISVSSDGSVVSEQSSSEQNSGDYPGGPPAGRLAVAPLPGTNIVIIAGPYEQVEAAISLLQFADQERPHVIIEALIIEADVAAITRLGSSITNGGSGEFSAIDFVPGGAFTDAITFSFLEGSSTPTQLTAMLDLLVRDDHARILSRPYASTLSHETASISITQDRYVIVEDAQFGGSTPVRSTRPISAGVTLRITPKVLGDEIVRVQLHVEESEFLSSSDSATVSTDKNSASTTMDIKSGRTIVIGGLYKKEGVTGNSGLPGLRHIPGLNLFFAQQEEVNREQEVIVYLTPHIWTRDTSPIPIRDIQRSLIEGKFEQQGTATD